MASEPTAVLESAKQMSSMSLAQSGNGRTDEDELDASLEEDRAAIAAKVEDIFESTGGDVEKLVAALTALREEMGLGAEDLLGFVFEAVFDEDVLKEKQVPAFAKLFLRLQRQCTKAKTAQQVMLVCVEALCGERHAEALLAKTPYVLKAFYDADLLEEEAILKWHEKKSKGDKKDISKKVKEAAEPFVTWLKEADEEDDDDDDDDDDEDED